MLGCNVPMIPLVLFALAFVVRAIVGVIFFQGPAYPDSFYYAHLAHQLAAGNGFSANYIWNLDDIGRAAVFAGSLPTAANAYWMPLAEIAAAPFVALFGPGPFATSVAFWIVGAIAAPLTYWIGRDAGWSKEAAVIAGALVAVPAGLTPFVAQTDTFGLFMLFGPLSLWLCARGIRGDRRAFALGGIVVGLATLTRIDGLLLGIPFALVAVLDLFRSQRRVGLVAAIGCLVLFLTVTLPWGFRQLEVFGSLVPSAASGRALWLIDYQQLFSLTNPPSFDQWLAQGLPWILGSRLGGLLTSLGLIALMPLAIVMSPFAVVGAWRERHNSAFVPFFIVVIALLAAMTLVFPILVPHGTLLHAAAALVPHIFLVTVVGIRAAVRWVAARRPSWRGATAVRTFSWLAVAIAVMAAGFQTVSTTNAWSAARIRQVDLSVPILAAPITDRFMAADPGAINYLTGRQGVVTPSDPLPTIEEVARAYNVRWLVLERDQIVPALVPVLTGAVKPAWLSRPVAVVNGVPSAIATTGPIPSNVPDGAVFAVCLTADDTRCQ